MSETKHLLNRTFTKQNNRTMNRESVTIKKTSRGVWLQRFDDYETKYKRISKNDALKAIELARSNGDMFCDGDENSETVEVFGYWN